MGDNKPEVGLSVLGVLDRMLAFMSSPWKATAVVVLVIVCGVLYIAYDERTLIAEAVLTRTGELARIDDSAFIADAPRLLRDTRSDLVMLVEVNVSDNLLKYRVGIDIDGNHWVPSTGPQQALLPESSMSLLVKFLANDVACIDTARAVNEDTRALGAKGYQRVCLVAVPPILGVQVGGLVVAWRQPLLPETEVRAGYVMKSAAMKYATW